MLRRLNSRAACQTHEMLMAALSKRVGNQSCHRDADLAHALMVGVGYLGKVVLSESGDEDGQGHEVQLAGLDA